MSLCFLCKFIPGTDCNERFKTASLTSLMTLGIASFLVIFHISYFDGWNFLGGSVASLIISWNQLWSSQKGLTMISSPLLLVFPRPSVLCLEVERHISGLLFIPPSEHLLPRLSCLRGLHWSTALKYCSSLNVFMLKISPALEFPNFWMVYGMQVVLRLHS